MFIELNAINDVRFLVNTEKVTGIVEDIDGKTVLMVDGDRIPTKLDESYEETKRKFSLLTPIRYVSLTEGRDL